MVAVSGDGGFLFNAQELATAVQYRVPVKVFVSNNGSFGTIRMHQEREHPSRVYGRRVRPELGRTAGTVERGNLRHEYARTAVTQRLRKSGMRTFGCSTPPRALLT